MDEILEIDQLEDIPLPRERKTLLGHDAAKKILTDAFYDGKMHHAWIISGSKGIGKATFAYNIARLVLSTPPNTSHQSNENNHVFQQVAAQSHPDLLVVKREIDQKTKRAKTEIIADSIRKASSFFAKTASNGGWRICIIDAADEMNISAANSLLKILEEPPQKTLFLLVCHNQGKLLPTIRSRCLTLHLNQLSDDNMRQLLNEFLPEVAETDKEDLNTIAKGSIGYALELYMQNGLNISRDIKEIITNPTSDNTHKINLMAEKIGNRNNSSDYRLFCKLIPEFVSDIIKEKTYSKEVDNKILRDMSVCWQEIMQLIKNTDILNLDRKQFIIQTFYLLTEAGISRKLT